MTGKHYSNTEEIYRKNIESIQCYSSINAVISCHLFTVTVLQIQLLHSFCKVYCFSCSVGSMKPTVILSGAHCTLNIKHEGFVDLLRTH